MADAIPLSELLASTTKPFVVLNDAPLAVSTVRSLAHAGPNDLSFAHGRHHELLGETRAGAIITDAPTSDLEGLANFGDVVWIVTDRPRGLVAEVAAAFVRAPAPGIHETAHVDPTAQLGARVSVGPLASIGPGVVLGDDVVIHAGVHLLHDVRVGHATSIGSGTVVGSVGFGYERDGDEWVLLPHLGTVVIGDRVDVGANTCIDRGTFGDTVIGDGAKIDNLVHVAHNVQVGEGAVVIANAMIGGSTAIDHHAWIAPSASLMNGISIGAESIVGLGAVVLRDVDAGQTVAGVPAKPI